MHACMIEASPNHIQLDISVLDSGVQLDFFVPCSVICYIWSVGHKQLFQATYFRYALPFAPHQISMSIAPREAPIVKTSTRAKWELGVPIQVKMG